MLSKEERHSVVKKVIVAFIKKSRDKRADLHPKTTLINNAQREKSRESVRQVLLWLSQTFPKAFNVEGAIRPLKIGIFEDILAYAEKNGGLSFPKTKLRKALVVFTRRMEYLTCVKMRDTRVDLEGNEVEAVSEEGAKLASTRIRKTIEKNMKAKRKPRVHRGAPAPKRRFHSPTGTGYNNHHNPYHENSPREHGHYNYDSDAPSAPATIKVKKRYTPRSHDAHSYNNVTPITDKPYIQTERFERNYNSENYNKNAEISTVDRLKAKLGLKPRTRSENENEREIPDDE